LEARVISDHDLARVLPTAIAVLMAHFQRHFQYFASRENTRYD